MLIARGGRSASGVRAIVTKLRQVSKMICRGNLTFGAAPTTVLLLVSSVVVILTSLYFQIVPLLSVVRGHDSCQ